MPKTGERQLPAVHIDTWRGTFSNLDPHEIPPGGAQKQINLQLTTRGVLETRGGQRQLNFEN